MKRIHVICGMCGCASMLKFKIDQTGKDVDGNLFPSVSVVCENCSSLTGLHEVIEEVKP